MGGPNVMMQGLMHGPPPPPSPFSLWARAREHGQPPQPDEVLSMHVPPPLPPPPFHPPAHVNTGSPLRAHTANSLRVLSSSPLAPSTSMSALSAAASVRYVSSLKSCVQRVFEEISASARKTD